MRLGATGGAAFDEFVQLLLWAESSAMCAIPSAATDSVGRSRIREAGTVTGAAPSSVDTSFIVDASRAVTSASTSDRSPGDDAAARAVYSRHPVLLLDDVRAVLSGSVGALLVIAPQHYNCIEIFDKDHSLIADWTPETAQERHLRQQLVPSKLWRHMVMEEHRITG